MRGSRGGVVPKDPDDPPSESEIIDFCKGRIASYKKPTVVIIIDALPRNATGDAALDVAHAVRRLEESRPLHHTRNRLVPA